MRWLDGITDSADMNSSKLQEIEQGREAWHAAVHGVAKGQTRLKWLNNKTASYSNSVCIKETFIPLLHWSVIGYAAAAAAKSLQSCPTLCDPIDGSPPGSPVPGILQAGTLEWVAISFSNAWKWKVKGKSFSRVQLLAIPWTVAHQAPSSVGFSRQGYWSGVPLPSPVIGYRGAQRQKASSEKKPNRWEDELALIFQRFCFFLIPRWGRKHI